MRTLVIILIIGVVIVIALDFGYFKYAAKIKNQLAGGSSDPAQNPTPPDSYLSGFSPGEILTWQGKNYTVDNGQWVLVTR